MRQCGREEVQVRGRACSVCARGDVQAGAGVGGAALEGDVGHVELPGGCVRDGHQRRGELRGARAGGGAQAEVEVVQPEAALAGVQGAAVRQQEALPGFQRPQRGRCRGVRGLREETSSREKCL